MRKRMKKILPIRNMRINYFLEVRRICKGKHITNKNDF